MIPAPAALTAAHRARETARADAAFHDPYARALLGEPGVHAARVLGGQDATEWFFTVRTYAFDRLIAKEVTAGADLVVNLAAGLDARPYRLQFPAALRWADVDTPEILEYKAEVLRGATASCRVEQHAVDLFNPDARRGLFRDLARSASSVVVVSEQLLMHLMAHDAMALAEDLAAPAPFQRWIADVVSPALLQMLGEQSGDFVRETGAPFLFAPYDGPAAFTRAGWEPLVVRPLLPIALKLERLSMALRMLALLRDGQPYADRPWAGACVFGKKAIEPRVE